MNKEWSLDKLYLGYDDPKFAADEAALDTTLAEFTSFCKELTGDASMFE